MMIVTELNQTYCHTPSVQGTFFDLYHTPASTMCQVDMNTIAAAILPATRTGNPHPILGRVVLAPVWTSGTSGASFRFFFHWLEVFFCHKSLSIVYDCLGDQLAPAWVSYTPFFPPAERGMASTNGVIAFLLPFPISVLTIDMFGVVHLYLHLEDDGPLAFLSEWSVQGEVGSFIEAGQVHALAQTTSCWRL